MKNKRKIDSLVFGLILVFTSCQNWGSGSAQPEVIHHGTLKNMMHKNDISAKADLVDLENLEHVYALGAIENLKGEILILDSKPYVSSVQNKALHIDRSFNKKASLLVYASVPEWQKVEIPNDVVEDYEFELFVSLKAHEMGLDTNEAFPFIVTGKVSTLSWHVIDWPEGDNEHSHQKHVESGLNGKLKDSEVEILGFYSNKHHAIFTHHSTNMHLHVKTSDDKLAGHIDALTLGSGMELKLPLVN